MIWYWLMKQFRFDANYKNTKNEKTSLCHSCIRHYIFLFLWLRAGICGICQCALCVCVCVSVRAPVCMHECVHLYLHSWMTVYVHWWNTYCAVLWVHWLLKPPEHLLFHALCTWISSMYIYAFDRNGCTMKHMTDFSSVRDVWVLIALRSVVKLFYLQYNVWSCVSIKFIERDDCHSAFQTVIEGGVVVSKKCLWILLKYSHWKLAHFEFHWVEIFFSFY